LTETAEDKTPAGTDRNISVIGRGRAIVDGGEPNGLTERTPAEEVEWLLPQYQPKRTKSCISSVFLSE
jgi:hypothetical protein